ncbi:3'(2'),5'-bisphosphate nucleotidase CysQ [Shewanella intestini]|uniref:3'(2'),5'-bisphosphate nucleotidase CysQ n=2 Tax=Shewanellaceae TaxID=267890 RepID=A0ABS5HYH4_9GAMM|nr:3'(2'),5'-bisphosphate nucleotidase CysQ [Shewanella intestini]MRG34594.1 3'(2'),5'-bisphosphate nucleotidase CysQ [Shewanella sp. XMDDZSB0408]
MLVKLEQLAKQAGAAILRVYGKPALSVTQKLDDSPVTEADIASHNVIIQGLEQHFAQYPILSEESAKISWQQRRQWQTYWLIDPLDGTKEFIKRNGEFTVNIALIHQGKPVVGVVFAPVLNKCYSGIVGQGAWLSQVTDIGEKRTALSLKHRQINAQPIVVGSRSHMSPDVANYVASIGEHSMQSVGSSLKFCMVAEGLADVYPRLGPTSEWDTGAAQAVLESAGGQVLIYPQLEPLIYNQQDSVLNPYFIAASPAWFQHTDTAINH